jgi:hypothetical protein
VRPRGSLTKHSAPNQMKLAPTQARKFRKTRTKTTSAARDCVIADGMAQLKTSVRLRLERNCEITGLLRKLDFYRNPTRKTLMGPIPNTPTAVQMVGIGRNY